MERDFRCMSRAMFSSLPTSISKLCTTALLGWVGLAQALAGRAPPHPPARTRLIIAAAPDGMKSMGIESLPACLRDCVIHLHKERNAILRSGLLHASHVRCVHSDTSERLPFSL